MTRFRRLALAPACASLLVLAACGSDDSADPSPADSVASTEVVGGAAATPTPDPATAENPAGGDENVPEILRFSAPAVGGGEIDAAALAGTPTVFWFWAPT